MKKNLTARSVVIAVTILLCIYGIIGFPTSKAALVDNIQKNIHLGLDLKGGSHLVLEVQVQDAVKADADTTMERLKEDLKKQNIQWAGMDRNDPQTVADADKVDISIKGVPSTEIERVPQYRRRAVPYLRAHGGELHRLHDAAEADRVDRPQARHRAAHHGHIGNRIDQLGLAEKSVQQYGRSGSDYQILVQLPGVDDPARVKELIGTAAVLEIDDVKDGPFPSPRRAAGAARRRSAARHENGEGQAARRQRG